MRNKWVPAVCAAVVVLAGACSSGGMSAAKGKEQANRTRKATAAVYWKVYNSFGAPVAGFEGSGYFTECGKKGSTSVQYIVHSLVGATSDKKVTSDESLMQTVTDQLAGAGWHLTASEDGSSAEKGGITVELKPPEFSGSDPHAALQVESGCVDVGAAVDAVSDGYYANSNWDRYKEADASKSPVPTTFPPSAG